MKFGLIGKSLSHSFSKSYFTEKFKSLEGPYTYENFELEDIQQLTYLVRSQPELVGLNITIPYKEEVIPLLDEISDQARTIGAVNTIRIQNGRLLGFNTDVVGFKHSLQPLLTPFMTKALILGSGGASKAVAYSLNELGIDYKKVSRSAGSEQLNYDEASQWLDEYLLVINTTPLGTIPKLQEMPPLQLEKVSENHLFYDLIYNPAETALLKAAHSKGAKIKNGYEMLVLQAEESWKIWNAQ